MKNILIFVFALITLTSCSKTNDTPAGNDEFLNVKFKNLNVTMVPPGDSASAKDGNFVNINAFKPSQDLEFYFSFDALATGKYPYMKFYIWNAGKQYAPKQYPDSSLVITEYGEYIEGHGASKMIEWYHTDSADMEFSFRLKLQH